MNSWSSVVLMVLLVALKKHQFQLPFKRNRQFGENSERLPHPTAIAASGLDCSRNSLHRHALGIPGQPEPTRCQKTARRLSPTDHHASGDTIGIARSWLFAEVAVCRVIGNLTKYIWMHLQKMSGIRALNRQVSLLQRNIPDHSNAFPIWLLCLDRLQR